MYGQLLILIENRTDDIARKLVQEMQVKREIRHYLRVPEKVREERFSNVIRDMCDRLGLWLNRETPRTSLSAHYSRLGAKRCREGIPLDEVVLVFMLVKRGIWDELKHKLVVDNSFTLGHLRELENNYHLFFDRMIQSVITGYVSELGKPGDGGAARGPACRRTSCRAGIKGIRGTSQTAKEEKA